MSSSINMGDLYFGANTAVQFRIDELFKLCFAGRVLTPTSPIGNRGPLSGYLAPCGAEVCRAVPCPRDQCPGGSPAPGRCRAGPTGWRAWAPRTQRRRSSPRRPRRPGMSATTRYQEINLGTTGASCLGPEKVPVKDMTKRQITKENSAT